MKQCYLTDNLTWDVNCEELIDNDDISISKGIVLVGTILLK